MSIEEMCRMEVERRDDKGPLTNYRWELHEKEEDIFMAFADVRKILIEWDETNNSEFREKREFIGMRDAYKCVVLESKNNSNHWERAKFKRWIT